MTAREARCMEARRAYDAARRVGDLAHAEARAAARRAYEEAREAAWGANVATHAAAWRELVEAWPARAQDDECCEQPRGVSR